MTRALIEGLTFEEGLAFEEEGEDTITAHPEQFGDVVLARKTRRSAIIFALPMTTRCKGNLVTRGEDLKQATHLHRLLRPCWAGRRRSMRITGC